MISLQVMRKQNEQERFDRERTDDSRTAIPAADAEALATAIWALVHGFAFLYLDGKLDATTPAVVADRVTAAIRALLTATSADTRAAALG